MVQENYTPGHSKNAVAFMATRTFESHCGFFAPYIDDSVKVLDVGCGPGSLTMGIAERAKSVIGVDFGESQIETARQTAAESQIAGVEFVTASCYELPFENNSFDRVFSHALMEHLAEPVDALREFLRVLKPGGIVGVCSPDFDGRLLAPSTSELETAADAYANLQASNGGDLRIGKKLGGYLIDAGFVDVQMSARYECYPQLNFIGEYLALQLNLANMPDHADCFRRWSKSTTGMFAQSWVSAIGVKS